MLSASDSYFSMIALKSLELVSYSLELRYCSLYKNESNWGPWCVVMTAIKLMWNIAYGYGLS